MTIKSFFYEPKYFYAFTISLIYIPISFASGIPFFMVLIPAYSWLISKIELLTFFSTKLICLTLLIPISVLVELFVIPYLFYFLKIEGNVFAFTFIFTAIPILIINLISLFVSFVRIAQKKVEKKYTTNTNGIREIKNEKKDKIIKVIIHDKDKYTFESLKNNLIKQYSLLGFDETIIDDCKTWMVRSLKPNESYVVLSHIKDEYIIEIYDNEYPNIN